MQPPIPTGTVLQNRYRLINLLGQGGFGRTYLVEDQGRFNELCALKELTPPQTGYALEKSKELFQREAQILYQIEHPQIPKFRAMFEEDQRLFLAQDFVEGKTYRDLLDDRKARGFVFSEPEIVQLMQQVLPVLSYLHGKGIIHRDIAPDNMILRDRDQLPVLIDFGVVKEIATRLQQDVGKQATTVGKLGYAPIEQMQTGNAYPNSDLYALAVSAVVLLTGREPQEVLDDNTMTWTWQRWCQVSPAFAQVINRMLSITPNQRYASAIQVQQALQSPTTSAGVPQTQAPSEAPSEAPAQKSASSSMATVAVGRGFEDQGSESRVSSKRSPNAVPERTTLWDDPWAVALIGLGLASLAAIGTWAIASALKSKPIAEEPTPITTPTLITTPTPTPSATPKPTPSEKPTAFSQNLELTPGKPATRSGNLTANQTFTFTIPAKQAQTLSASLGGEGVLMTVLGPDKNPVGDRAKRTTFWKGELPFTGEYGIQLTPIKGLSKADFTLDLELSEAAVPTPSPTLTASPSPSPSNNDKVERIIFDPGKTIASASGRADGQQGRRYLVNVKAGQQMEVTIQGAKMNVLDPSGNAFPDAKNIPTWRGLQLPVGGDYQIEIVTTGPVDYSFSIEVR
jgi:serine/threonine protein kinase